MPGVNIEFIQKNIKSILQYAMQNVPFDDDKSLSPPAAVKMRAANKPLQSNSINTTTFLQFSDEVFSGYNANRIEKTKFGVTPFVAGQGPHDHQQVASLFQQTLFNPACRVDTILALVSSMHPVKAEVGVYDCVDYFSPGRRQYGEYTVKSVLKSDNCYELTVINAQNDSRMLNVYCLPAIDGRWFDFKAMANDDWIKGFLLKTNAKISQADFEENIFVHCHAGVGRTGHIIATMLLLRHFEEIFAGEDPQAIGEQIKSLVQDIRKYRPCLMQWPEQMEYAIRNAVDLYQLQLRLQNVPVSSLDPRAFPIPEVAKWPDKNRENQPLLPQQEKSCCLIL